MMLVAFAGYQVLSRRLLVILYAGDDESASKAHRRLRGVFFLAAFGSAIRLAVPLAHDPSAQVVTWIDGFLICVVSIFILEFGRVVTFDLILRYRRKVAVPKIIQDLISGLFYLTVGLVLLGRVYKLDITPILTVSGLLSLVIGMALQDTLGNFFAGLAINLEPPFNLGDWVTIDGMEVKVLEVTWRATKFQTRSRDVLVVPNNAISKSKIINHAAPTTRHDSAIRLEVPNAVAPTDVQDAIYEALRGANVIQGESIVVPQVFKDSTIEYNVGFSLHDFAHLPLIRADVVSRIWFKFQQRGIPLASEVRNVYMQDAESAAKSDQATKKKALAPIDFLAALSPEVRQSLVDRALIVKYCPAESIFHQGDQGDSLYIVAEGEVELLVEAEDGPKQLAVLGPGEFFGEMALLTGEARSASARSIGRSDLVKLSKDAMEATFTTNSDVPMQISRIIAERKVHTEQRKRELGEELEAHVAKAGDEPAEAASVEILARIRAFFRLS